MKKKFYEKYCIDAGKEFRLAKIDPNDTSFVNFEKEEAGQLLRKLNSKLDALQELLYAESKHKILVILQGMDT